MKKLGDALRMLSSVLLGIVIRDADTLTSSLRTYFFDAGRIHTQYADFAATIAPYVFTAVFIRNIHGSAEYDAFVEESHYVPSFEHHTLGRFATFIMSLAGLFVGPFLADHALGNHLADLRPAHVGLILFLPILVYAAWNTSLWLADSESPTPGASRMHVFASRWLAIDAVGFIVVTGLTLYSLYARAHNAPVAADASTLLFLIVAAGTIVADYAWNSAFYFPPPSTPAALGPGANESVPA